MSYIGREPIIGNFVKLDAISVVNGQASYTMQNGGANFTAYETVNQFLVSLNGILQAPTTSFTVSGSTITFASNLVTGDVIDFIMVLGNTLDIGTPSDNTVSLAKLTATGTKDATTFLRGDNTFAEPSGGKTLGVTELTNSTRSAFSDAVEILIWSTSYTQIKANSKLRIDVLLNGKHPKAGAINIRFKYDGVNYDGRIGYIYHATNWLTYNVGTFMIDGSATTGSKTIEISSRCEDGITLDTAMAVFNPNSSDDARLAQTQSSIIITEYDF